MYVIVDERPIVTDGYVANFSREGITSVGLLGDDFEEWLQTAPATDLDAVQGFLLGDCEQRPDLPELIHKRSRAPIIAMIETRCLTETLNLFGAGIDDVVRKPVHVREILARTEAVWRRSQREAEANRLLRDVDTADLPPTLAGAVGLTQASLTVTENPNRAIILLDGVRLLVPGTLAEEGALRREIFALGQLGELKKFEALAIQYLRRFPHSIYAGNFRQRLAYQLTQFDVGQDEERFAVLNRILNELGLESRRDLYLLIAWTAIQQGKAASALLAADKALALCAPGSPEAMQGRLYRAAAEIVNLKTFQSGLQALRSLDRAKLTARDVILLDTALSTAEEIGRGLTGWPGLPEADLATAKPAQAVAESAGEPASLIPKAQATIDRIDLLLSKASP